MNILQSLAKLLFREECLICREIGSLCCKNCIKNIPGSMLDNSRLLSEYIHPVFDYRNKTISKLIWRLKYSNSTYIADVFGERTHEVLQSLINELFEMRGVTSVVFIPIPLSNKRLKERGYNQSELIMKSSLKHKLNIPYSIDTKSLVRKNLSSSQVKTKNKSARMINIQGSFSVLVSERIKGKDIILFDDVVTTGSTLKEARKVLLASGARSVHAVVLAH